MTNTDTSNVESTVRQILELNEAGSQVVRITVNDLDAAKAVPEIINTVRKTSEVPIVGDFHFNGNILLKKVPECAQLLDKYRINPGNASDENFREMIEIAIKNNKPVRIGVNGGSLDQNILDELMDLNAKSPTPQSSEIIFEKSMIKSALNSAKLAEEIGLSNKNIVLSVKMSEVPRMISVYRALAAQCDYALHLGLTEAGGGDKGIISSSIALGVLLEEGIGDTIRVSLTPEPGAPRTKEVQICQEILQSLELQHFRPSVTSCPGCGRTTSTYFQELAQSVNKKIDQEIERWKIQYPGVENLKIAVMGCVVNGPGESKNADIGISLPGKMETPIAPVYIKGKHFKDLKGDTIEAEFFAILEEFMRQEFV